MSSFKEQIRYQFTAERWLRFFRSRLWLGLPIAALSAFVVILLIALVGGMERGVLFSHGARWALVVAISYLFGLLLLTCKTPEEIEAAREKERQEALEQTSKMTRLKAALGIFAGGLFLILLFILPGFVESEREGVSRVEIVVTMVGDALTGLTFVAVQLVEYFRK